MNWKQLKAEINWEKVDSTIIDTKEEFITQERFKSAKKLVIDAAEYFLPLDLKYFKIREIEKPYLYRHENAVLPDKGVIDLVLEIRNEAEKPYNGHTGKIMICDWKSTSTALDTAWRDRHSGSWQWRRYAAVENASLFEYRGVSTKTYYNNNEFKSTCGLLILEVPSDNESDCITEFLALEQMKLSLEENLVYPRNMPNACYKYGEDCAFLDDCTDKTMPLSKIELTHASYSSDEVFKLCPEKFRRQKLIDEKVDNYESASYLGSMFHRGIAEIYTQMKEKQ